MDPVTGEVRRATVVGFDASGNAILEFGHGGPRTTVAKDDIQNRIKGAPTPMARLHKNPNEAGAEDKKKSYGGSGGGGGKGGAAKKSGGGGGGGADKAAKDKEKADKAAKAATDKAEKADNVAKDKAAKEANKAARDTERAAREAERADAAKTVLPSEMTEGSKVKSGDKTFTVQRQYAGPNGMLVVDIVDEKGNVEQGVPISGPNRQRKTRGQLKLSPITSAAKHERAGIGGYPIKNEQDLKNAIKAYGRARPEDKAKTRKHIISEAKRLGKTSLLPDDWAETKALSAAIAPGLKQMAKGVKQIFQAWQHPRGKGGKFVEKGGSVNVEKPGGGKRRAKITELTPEGPEIEYQDGAKETEVITLDQVGDILDPAEPSMARLDTEEMPSVPAAVQEAQAKVDTPDAPEPVDIPEDVTPTKPDAGEFPKAEEDVPLTPEAEAVVKANKDHGATSPEFKAAMKAYREALKPAAFTPKIDPSIIQNAMNLTPQQKINNVALMFGENSPEHKKAKARYAPRSGRAPRRPNGLQPSPDDLIAWTQNALAGG